jgi:iron(III) transport system ATP-binding protein
MDDHSILEATGLSYAYPGRAERALRDVSVTIRAGESVAILGESGSGKSTLVSLLAGIADPTLGRVTLNGRDVALVQAHVREFALAFQRPPLLRGIRVGEIVARAARRAVPPHGPSTVAEALAQVGMSGFDHRFMSELSSGQVQRVHLARSLVWRPKYLLLDEALSSIDSEAKSRIYPILKRHQLDCRAALVLVTHDSREARLMCDRVLVMRDGLLIADDSGHRLTDVPPVLGTARLLKGIGTNLIEVRLVQEHGSTQIIPDTFLRSLGGHFAPIDGSAVMPKEAVALFEWYDLVPEPSADDRGQQEAFVSTTRGSVDTASPAMYVRGPVALYARMSGAAGGRVVAFKAVARSVPLYSIADGCLLGTMRIDAAEEEFGVDGCVNRG